MIVTICCNSKERIVINDTPSIIKLLANPYTASFDSLIWDIYNENQLAPAPVIDCFKNCMEIKIDSSGQILDEDVSITSEKLIGKISEFLNEDSPKVDSLTGIIYPNKKFHITIHKNQISKGQELLIQVSKCWSTFLTENNSTNVVDSLKTNLLKKTLNPLRPRVLLLVQTWNDSDIVEEIIDIDSLELNIP